MKVVFLFGFLMLSNLSFGQVFNMDGTPINSCTGSFFDSGGADGTYGNNESLTTTICPSTVNPTGTHIRLTFAPAEITAPDNLCFYDGLSTAEPLIACSNEFLPNAPFIIQATATNLTGCLTVEFISDGSGVDNGWQAAISCIAACQTIKSVLVSSDPPVSPVDTGYIDICPGQRVFLSGAGEYPQDGSVYNHSDLTSSFEWDYGDGTTGVGPNVSHVYDEPGGYVIQLTITDQLGCTNTNILNQRVRVSTAPTFDLTGDIPTQICAGDTLELNAAVANNNSATTIGVSPTQGGFPTGGIVSDSLALPDGDGVSYSSDIVFTNFSAGQTLTNIDDLLQICVLMEHSYLGDLDIQLECPDGSTVELYDGNGIGGTFLGEPVDNDATPLLQGVGYEYCWTVDATNGTWGQYIQNNNPSPALPAGNYNSEEPLTGFLGCPLNGIWQITVTDNLAFDNGYIFEWSIQFDPSLYPNVETFTPEIVDFGWTTNPSIFFQTNDSIAAAPQNAGTGNYIFEVTDNFGCTYDTSLSVSVLPATHPDCYECPTPTQNLEDASICAGDPLQLDATNTSALAPQDVTFGSFPNYGISNVNHPNTNPYEASLEVNSIFPLLINNAQQQICGVCLDLETDFTADIRLWLRSPSGQLLELSTQNGGAGDNYTGTCFTPSATTPVIGSAAPFTGNFMPEGDWADLNGSQINGDWQLLVSDDFGLSEGELLSWSMCFNLDNDIQYQWTPATGLSCDDCPDPLATPTATTTYSLSISDNLGCNFTDDVTIDVSNNIAAPTLISCESVTGGNLELVWDAVPGYTDYEININGTGWGPANGTLSHTAGGFTNGDIVNYEIQVVATNANCTLETLSASCTYQLCNLSLSLVNSTPPNCANTADGAANVSAVDGMFPFTYILNGGTGQSLPSFSDIPAGDNVITVVDMEGCRDSVMFNLSAPDSLTVSFTIDSVSCAGTSTGSATAIGGGGSGGAFSYTWNTSPLFSFTPTINDLAVGEYIVTVSENGCELIDTIEIFEPMPLSGTIQSTNVLCNAGATGTAIAAPTGGSGPYSYMWSNGGTTAEIMDLVAGTYTVTITDNSNCTFEDDVELTEPTGMVVQIDSVDVKCFNNLDGEILLEVNGGAMPYTFLWDDQSTQEDRNDLGVGTHCVTITDNNDCSIVRCVTLDQPTELVIDNITSTSTTCLNNNTDGTATVTPSGGTGVNYEFLWSDPAGQTTGLAENLQPGQYCVTVSDQNQCTATACVDVESPVAILVDSIVGTDLACNGDDSGLAQVYASGGSIATDYTYLWSDNLSQFANPANGLEAGSYIVTVTDDIGCTVSASVLIEEPLVLTTTIEVTNVNCFEGSDGTATAQPLGGVEPYQYLWGTSPFIADQTATGLEAGPITVTVTDANGCVVDAVATLSAPSSAVVATASQTFVGCFDADQGAATVVAAGGTGTTYDYSWNTLPTPSNTANVTNLDSIEYIVTVTDQNGCEAFDTLKIEELDEIIVNVIQVPPSCHGLTDGQIGVNIVTGGVGNDQLENYSYAWNNGSTTPLNPNLGAGNYIVTVTDAQGCSNSSNVSLSEPAAITATAVIQDALCFNGTDGQIVVTPDGNDTYTYQWAPNANNQTTATATGLGVGNYAVVLTDSNGCTGDTSFVVGEPQQLNIEFAVEDNPCSGDTIGTITTTITGGVPNFNFDWTSSSLTFNSSNENLSSLNAGMYTLVLTDANGCVEIDSTLVTSPPALSAVTQVDSVSCFGDSDGHINVEAQGGSGPFLYSIDGVNYTPSNDFLGLEAGGYTLYIQDVENCTYEIFNEVGSPEEIVVSLGENITINFGQAANLEATVTPAGNYSYFWSPTDSLNCNFCESTFNPSAIGLSNQTSFSVEVVNEFGCAAEDFINVYVLKNRKVFVPTGFSPNNDGNNDLLRTHGREGTKVLTFKVFDRWGEMVYENLEPFGINDPGIGWNVVFKDKEMNSGVYVWILEVEFLDGAKDVYKGNTTLIR